MVPSNTYLKTGSNQDNIKKIDFDTFFLEFSWNFFCSRRVDGSQVSRTNSEKVYHKQDMKIYGLTLEEIAKIHTAIHTVFNPSQIDFTINISKAGYRWTRVSGILFIEQDPKHLGFWGEEARNGKQITWFGLSKYDLIGIVVNGLPRILVENLDEDDHIAD
jgi:hypothetical protein